MCRPSSLGSVSDMGQVEPQQRNKGAYIDGNTDSFPSGLIHDDPAERWSVLLSGGVR